MSLDSSLIGTSLNISAVLSAILIYVFDKILEKRKDNFNNEALLFEVVFIILATVSMVIQLPFLLSISPLRIFSVDPSLQCPSKPMNETSFIEVAVLAAVILPVLISAMLYLVYSKTEGSLLIGYIKSVVGKAINSVKRRREE